MFLSVKVQRIWKAHRLRLFHRHAHARGQQALVFIANEKFSAAQARHSGAVTLQRRVRVFLAVSRKRRVLAEKARQLQLSTAAVKMQAFTRCEMTRKNYSRERTRGLAYAKMMVRRDRQMDLPAATLTFTVYLMCRLLIVFDDVLYLTTNCFARLFWVVKAMTCVERWSCFTIRWIFSRQMDRRSNCSCRRAYNVASQ